MTAIVLGLLTAVLFGSAAYLGPVLSRSHSPSAVLAVGQVAAVAAAAAPVLAVGGAAPAPHWLLLGGLAGVANGVALTAMFEAARYLRISVMAPIGATGGAVPVVVALVLGERPSAWQLAGIPLAIVGVVLVAAGQGRRAAPVRPSRPVGLWLAAGWAVSYGLFLSLFAEAAEGGEAWAVLTSRAALLGTAVVLPLLRGTSLRLPGRAVPLAVVNGLLILSGVTTFALATQVGLVSVVSVLSTLSPLVTVALAVVLLRERLVASQRVGLAAALSGVALLAVG
ncbi:EamA family transporter [Geodermatophilus sp. YIM 151500]|uniref:EamA family transporter n=1 Tax=Geodermatophilus sp. YIM 151500 TaxID=2984531 RepID=UPI0021E3BC50|nr:EamA family transporter [Geodermatophilus sp. YIM 151500]MCV2488859.1 EamA family transporter [Geodermatophilus sp. YIM 151500]